MRGDRWMVLFLTAAAGAAAYLAHSSEAMPDVVAAHFAASGAANGFMPRRAYVTMMLTVVVALPVALALMTRAAVARPGARINLPHREYWLAPERRDATIARLRAGILQFNVLLIAFLCYAHSLVVRANAVRPPALPAPRMIAGLVVFFVAVIVWTRSFVRGFRRPA